MSYVFVSHSRTDTEAGCRISEALRNAGLKVWKEDVSQSGFPQERESALNSAACVVVVWSRGAKREYASTEEFSEPLQSAFQAWSSGRLVLALLDDTELPIGLRDLSPISIRDELGLVQLVANVSAMVRTPNSRAAKPSMRRWWIATACGLVVSTAGALSFFLWPSASPTPASEEAAHHHDMTLQSLQPPQPPDLLPLLTKRLQNGISSLKYNATRLSPQEIQFRIDDLEYLANSIAHEINERDNRSPSASDQSVSKMTLQSIEPTGLTTQYAVILLLVFLSVIAIFLGLLIVGRRLDKKLGLELESSQSNTRIFISYSHRDLTLVERINRQIEELGYITWIDRKKGGARRFAGPIVEAIQHSGLVALMCSKNAFSSDHVVREVYIAGKYKKSFITFKLDSIDIPAELDYFLSGFPIIQVSNVSSRQLRAEIAKLITP